MELINRLKSLAARAKRITSKLETEEATKNALVMPFLTALGYDVFDPEEIVPEFTADVGTKKGEKVDYAVMRDNVPLMLFEAKAVDVNLREVHVSQLYRYFTVTRARVGVLTNGLLYRFFMDLDETNKMDAKPFFEFDLLDFNEFDAAAEMRYTREIRAVFEAEATEPSDDFVKFFAVATGSGRLTKSLKEVFRPLIVKAIKQYIADRISERLQHALDQEVAERPADATPDAAAPKVAPPPTAVAPPEAEAEPPQPDGESLPSDGIETTDEEMMGYRIVQAIAAQVTDPSNITLRDAKSYCSILFGDNNRKPVCRLRFNAASVKYLGLFDAEKNEERVPIESVMDLYQHSPRILAMVSHWSE
jgi:hypothetical protein